jgi:hypothetical protein
LTAHFVGHVPPQSTAVSEPFITPSVQLAPWQMLLVHTPLWQSAETVQPEPFGQFVAQVPPQSTPVSLPFFTPSVQVGVAHALFVHTPLVQSPGTEHAAPFAHFVVQVPPQSTAVSEPFFTVSVHDAVWQTPAVHTPLAGSTQSVAFAHFLPAPHAVHVPPPQSTSVSAPFWTLSLQPAPWQAPAVQTPLAQSVGKVHAEPVPHFEVHVPPQSMAVSEPFWTPSAQPAAAHLPLVHLPLAGRTQSMLPEHSLPTAHFDAHDPPQSVSVSGPLRTRSVQLAAAQAPLEQTPSAGSAQSLFA